MDAVELTQVDLNLLVALRALLRHRHVSRAAAEVNLSQPAMSRCLARLRDLFGDPLLVRVGNEMHLTARALELTSPLEDALEEVGKLFHRQAFDPAVATGSLRIAVPDVIAYMLLPGLLARLREKAPQLDVAVEAWRPDWKEHLESGQIDLSLATPVGQAAGIHARRLVEHHWACVLRKGHPAMRKKWNLDTYLALQHVLVNVTGRGGGQVDAKLEQRGLSRRVALRVPSSLLAGLIVSETDMIWSTARWLALKMSEDKPLVLRRIPVEVSPQAVHLVWHERSHHDPRARWLRQQIIEAVDDLPPRTIAWS